MRLRKNQFGLAALEVVLLLLIAAIIGFTGYKVFKAKQVVDNVSQSAVQTSDSQKPLASPTAAVPAVNSTTDLDKSQQALDKENPDDNAADVNQLDSQT